MICDANTYYVLQAFPYTGKTYRIEEVLGEHVVEPLFRHRTKCDNRQFLYKPFYCQEAQKHKITMAGTVCQNRKEIPEEIK